MARQLAFIDKTADRKYFTIIPNVIWTMNLSSIAFRLYTTIKKIAGENGLCFMGTRRLAREAGISAGSVSTAKHELERAGLITIVRRKRSTSGQPIDHVQVSDIWPQNMAHFAKCSADEPRCSAGEHGCSGDETEEEHEEEQGRSDVDESLKQSFDALALFGVDTTVAHKLATQRPIQHILAWIDYAKTAKRLRDPVGFVVRRLLDNEPPPTPRPPNRNAIITAACAACSLVFHADQMCPTCTKCPHCCTCQQKGDSTSQP